MTTQAAAVANTSSNGPDPERPWKPVLAAELTDLLAARRDDGTIHSVAYAAYASSASRGLPGRVTMKSRLRVNAAIFALAPPRTGNAAARGPGRPARKPAGDRDRRQHQLGP